ncbi:MAG: ribosome-binding factor A [Deltaproteobacteria bacterium CG_4_8_14_3_um_filter_51_11]|nr:30S ribosome-binding factor RbfA [bacterium]OIP43884.1 MAG: ribosome-binding factor A [Desulfobacteraceae bacterium CG2_30_51_40]PIP45202.1 MAG: ribosome-binding factor A [Deltaproteobacteria bacterium CG23_combo_of_CG06-09_8_20_14_all_51_20]PIX19326.1 MAG: ribosome-binding factor A [Deltaproteobacteria bacterium CG_4_8_14_3_um_filter_51_11]PIY25764.1 MAG: ribosome-binding factor A [Deltaproteobacteria bacterium CG_4_10_14_3_um_filter_51_14]PJB34955.1 MAG: ribosome-binding factor A [Deltapr
MEHKRRAIRVGNEILKEINQLLCDGVKDPRVQGVTLTGIDLSNDLRDARIFFSVLPGYDYERAGQGLERATGFIRREIGARMKLKYVPAISFRHDSTLEKAAQMEKIFEKIHYSES